MFIEANREFKRRICAIGPISDGKDFASNGFGCLVAPDVIVTCWHVIRNLLSDGKPIGAKSATVAGKATYIKHHEEYDLATLRFTVTNAMQAPPGDRVCEHFIARHSPPDT